MRTLGLLLMAGCGRYGFGGADAGPGEDGGGDAAIATGVTVDVSTTGDCPAAAFGDRLGVVWRERDTAVDLSEIRFVALDVDGAIVQGPRVIASGLTYADCPAIAWNGAGEFLVAVAYGAINRADIDVSRVGAGDPTPLANVVTDSGDSTRPRLATRGAVVVLTWEDQQGTNYNVQARALSQAGAPLAPAFTASGISATNGPPAVTATESGFVLAWGATGVHLRELDANGSPARPELVLSAPADPNGSVPVTWTGSELVVAWTIFAGDTVATARSDLDGTVTSGPFMFDAPRASDAVFAWTGSSAAVAYNEYYGTVQVHLAELTPTAELLVDRAAASSTTTTTPWLVWLGDRFAVTYDNLNGAHVLITTP